MWPRLVCVLFLAGCTDLDSYAGSYEGIIIGSDGESFIRRGFPAGTRLELTGFDPPPTSDPTRVADVRIVHGTDELLVGTLVQIAPLEHDQLSQYDFPGGGRIRSFIFAVSTTSGTLATSEPMAFVSLMDDGNVEVRMIAGDDDLFGVFILGAQ